MVRQQIRHVPTQVRTRLESAILEESSPQEVAISFSLGLFVTALPTLGIGLVVFVALAYIFKQLSKIALFASVLVLSPPIKWGVYVSSYWIGQRFLGPLPGISFEGRLLTAGLDVLARLLVGNLLLAAAFAAVGYIVALRFVLDFGRRIDSA